MRPKAKAQAPGPEDVEREAELKPPSRVARDLSVFSLTLSSLWWRSLPRCGTPRRTGRRSNRRRDDVVCGVDPLGANLAWAGQRRGQPAKQRDADDCEQHDLGCSCCFHAIGLLRGAHAAELDVG